MNCPHCGKPIQTQQSRAATSQWSKMTPDERKAEMSRRRRKPYENPSGKITIKVGQITVK